MGTWTTLASGCPSGYVAARVINMQSSFTYWFQTVGEVHQHSLQILKTLLLSNSKPRQLLSHLQGLLACTARLTARCLAGSPRRVWVFPWRITQTQLWGWVLLTPRSRALGGSHGSSTEEETKGYLYETAKCCQHRDKSLWEPPGFPPPSEHLLRGDATFQTG